MYRAEFFMLPPVQVHQPERTSANSSRGSPGLASNGAPEPVKATETHKEESEDDGAWPASLRRYLQRAFDKCDKKPGSRQHALLEKALHRKVTDAMADNAMLTKDWDNEPLPRYAYPSEVDRIESSGVKFRLASKYSTSHYFPRLVNS